MLAIPTVVLVLGAVVSALPQPQDTYGTYVNPNPRPYDHCDAQDLIKLSTCSNDVLSKLDLCKANDLACECCALQSIDTSCYKLCPNNPSNNFLTVLFNDCASLNDINACSLPFQKNDGQSLALPDSPGVKSLADGHGDGSTRFKSKSKNKELDSIRSSSSVTVKSKVHNQDYDAAEQSGDDTDAPPLSSLKVNLLALDDHDDDDDDPSDAPSLSRSTLAATGTANPVQGAPTLVNATGLQSNISNASNLTALGSDCKSSASLAPRSHWFALFLLALALISVV